MVLNQTWTNPSAGNRLLPACCIFSAGNAVSSLEGEMLSRQFFASVEPKPSNILHRDELGFSDILATMVFTMVRLVRWEFPVPKILWLMSDVFLVAVLFFSLFHRVLFLAHVQKMVLGNSQANQL